MATVGSNKISPEQFCKWVFGGTQEPILLKKQTETVLETHKVHVDPATGKRYSIDKSTGESTWVVQHHSDEEIVKQVGTPRTNNCDGRKSVGNARNTY